MIFCFGVTNVLDDDKATGVNEITVVLVPARNIVYTRA